MSLVPPVSRQVGWRFPRVFCASTGQGFPLINPAGFGDPLGSGSTKTCAEVDQHPRSSAVGSFFALSAGMLSGRGAGARSGPGAWVA